MAPEIDLATTTAYWLTLLLGRRPDYGCRECQAPTSEECTTLALAKSEHHKCNARKDMRQNEGQR
eukprot:scaffold184918_cov35-Tisochrysis_lutea.AAC.1